MWSCHVLLLVPLLIAGLFLLLPWPVALPIALLVAGVTAMVIHAGVKVLHQRPMTGAEGMVGVIGEAATDMSPRGVVGIDGELWRGESTEPVARGQRVSVVRVEGLTVRVRPIQRDGGGESDGRERATA